MYCKRIVSVCRAYNIKATYTAIGWFSTSHVIRVINYCFFVYSVTVAHYVVPYKNCGTFDVRLNVSSLSCVGAGGRRGRTAASHANMNFSNSYSYAVHTHTHNNLCKVIIGKF